jgi:hypothetical protein
MDDEQQAAAIRNLQEKPVGTRSAPLYEPYVAKSHEERIQTKLSWLVFFGGVVAAGVIAQFIAAVVIAANAAVDAGSLF